VTQLGNVKNKVVDSALGILHHVDLGSVANVSEVHAASIFGIKISSLGIKARCVFKTVMLTTFMWCKNQRLHHHKH
jgi:hypothetical protein